MNSTARSLAAMLAVISFLFTPQASSALVAIAGGTMVYDDHRDITFLADANYAQTSGFDADGKMNWATALTWADNLVFGGFNDWRLPTAKNADDSGPNFGVGGELGHLYSTEFEGTGGSVFTANDPNNYLDLFTNLQESIYWYSEVYAPNPTFAAWCFSMLAGGACANDQTFEFYALPVRDGNAALDAPTVPIPGAIWLFGTGLLGLLGATRKRKK